MRYSVHIRLSILGLRWTPAKSEFAEFRPNEVSGHARLFKHDMLDLSRNGTMTSAVTIARSSRNDQPINLLASSRTLLNPSDFVSCLHNRSGIFVS